MRGDVVKGKRRDGLAMFRGQIGVLLLKPVDNLSSICQSFEISQTALVHRQGKSRTSLSTQSPLVPETVFFPLPVG